MLAPWEDEEDEVTYAELAKQPDYQQLLGWYYSTGCSVWSRTCKCCKAEFDWWGTNFRHMYNNHEAWLTEQFLKDTLGVE